MLNEFKAHPPPTLRLFRKNASFFLLFLFLVIEQYAKSPNWTPRQEARQPLFWKSIRAEFLGAFLLVIFSTSADPYVGPVSYGCTVAVLVYTLTAPGRTVHLSPVLTLAAVLLRSITPFRCVSLILAQSMGKCLFSEKHQHQGTLCGEKNRIMSDSVSFAETPSNRWDFRRKKTKPMKTHENSSQMSSKLMSIW